MMSKELSEDLRKKVVEKHSDEQSFAAIAGSVRVPKSTVASLIQKWKEWKIPGFLKMVPNGSRNIIRQLTKIVQMSFSRTCFAVVFLPGCMFSFTVLQ
uniref:Sleeping Beauty transposase HTH domain-containing protein n=1 Tax=Hippocampus comes TaxID=109280 RepID=A0A3Q2Z4H1_HIPCM